MTVLFPQKPGIYSWCCALPRPKKACSPVRSGKVAQCFTAHSFSGLLATQLRPTMWSRYLTSGCNLKGFSFRLALLNMSKSSCRQLTWVVKPWKIPDDIIEVDEHGFPVESTENLLHESLKWPELKSAQMATPFISGARFTLWTQLALGVRTQKDLLVPLSVSDVLRYLLLARWSS